MRQFNIICNKDTKLGIIQLINPIHRLLVQLETSLLDLSAHTYKFQFPAFVIAILMQKWRTEGSITNIQKHRKKFNCMAFIPLFHYCMVHEIHTSWCTSIEGKRRPSQCSSRVALIKLSGILGSLICLAGF